MPWKCPSSVLGARTGLHHSPRPHEQDAAAAAATGDEPQYDNASTTSPLPGRGGPCGIIIDPEESAAPPAAPSPPPPPLRHLIEQPLSSFFVGTQFYSRHEMAVENDDAAVDFTDSAALFANELKSYLFDLDALRQWMITL